MAWKSRKTASGPGVRGGFEYGGTISTTVSGADAVFKDLAELPDYFERKIIRKAVREAGKVGQRAAKKMVPVDDGDFRRSIVVRAAKSKRRGQARVRVFPDANKVPALITYNKSDGKRYFYPAIIEFGTQTLPALAPMRAAFDRSAQESLDTVVRVTNQGIDEFYGRG